MPMINILKKVFNWSEVHFSEMSCYKIHTLAVTQTRQPDKKYFYYVNIDQHPLQQN